MIILITWGTCLWGKKYDLKGLNCCSNKTSTSNHDFILHVQNDPNSKQITKRWLVKITCWIQRLECTSCFNRTYVDWRIIFSSPTQNSGACPCNIWVRTTKLWVRLSNTLSIQKASEDHKKIFILYKPRPVDTHT